MPKISDEIKKEQEEMKRNIQASPNTIISHGMGSGDFYDWEAKNNNALSVNKKDPNYEYRWISKGKVDLMRSRGFIPCNNKEIGRTGLYAVNGENGTVEANELVLCKRPKEIAESRAKFMEKKNRQQIKSLEANTKGFNGKVNIPKHYSKETD